MARRVSDNRYAEAAALRLALRKFLARTDQVSRAHGLTSQRYELLLLIKTDSQQGEATVGKLAKHLQIGQSAATQLVRRVKDIGLIERTVSPRDARIHPLRLTAEGERRLAAALTHLADERTALAEVLTATTAKL